MRFFHNGFNQHSNTPLFQHIIKQGELLCALCLLLLTAARCGDDGGQNGSDNETEAFAIDVHGHLHGIFSPDGTDFSGAAEAAVAAMDQWGIARMLIMPPPFTPQASQDGIRYECGDMSEVLEAYPGRFAFLCGGRDLNVMIQMAVEGREVSAEEFKAKAREIARTEGFAGFGEMATLHFCMGAGHVYEEAPPDHALFKALVDVAAEEGVPVDIHQEAVPEDMDFPELVTGGCEDNPPRLSANVERLKNLLDYAGDKSPPVNIIWDHLGWDNTRQWTAPLCEALLEQHDNLYMSIKTAPDDSPEDNRVVDSAGSLKPEWLALFQKYPERFMIGADQFFVSAGADTDFPPSAEPTWSIIAQLPEDLKTKLGYKNARKVFDLD